MRRLFRWLMHIMGSCDPAKCAVRDRLLRERAAHMVEIRNMKMQVQWWKKRAGK